ncbi:MAG: PfkB family carbohydrate kinase [Acidobacteriia bacterium]|nr:PfkB family carbohydrate kinase [Terriglobia bacterium]
MSVLVVGSVAFDSVETPLGRVNEVLGGSASYFSLAARFFTLVQMVAVVGEDFPEENLDMFRKFNINIQGLQRVEGKTFRWQGKYGTALNEAKTLNTELNVFENFRPEIPDSYQNTDFVFLGNIDPLLQKQVVAQMKSPKLVICDTMNYWIESRLPELREVLKLVDILIINDGEARMLTDEHNLNVAAKKIIEWGPRVLVVKKGEYGVSMYDSKSIFSAPAYPLCAVLDPTGAGDSFAGGFVGFLAKSGEINNQTLRRAVIYGSVLASFNVEEFSLNRLISLKYSEIEERFLQFKQLTEF